MVALPLTPPDQELSWWPRLPGLLEMLSQVLGPAMMNLMWLLLGFPSVSSPSGTESRNSRTCVLGSLEGLSSGKAELLALAEFRVRIEVENKSE